MEQKTVMAKPDDPVQSAMKAIQTIIENMTAKVDKYLNAFRVMLMLYPVGRGTKVYS